MKKVTASDVAKLAGVSQATVSFVLNSRIDISISQATRDKVIEAAKKLNYIPGTFSPVKTREKTKTIGLLVPTLSNPYYPMLVSVLENYASNRGYSLLVCNTNRRMADECFYLRTLYDAGVDGVMFGLTPHDPAYVNSFSEKLPIIVIGETDEHHKIPSIGFDSVLCGRMMTEHLIELGHRKFGFITTPIDNIAIGRKKRMEGVIKTIEEHKDCEVIVKIADHENELYDGTYEVEVGYQMAKELAKNKEITAIIGANDIIACGIIQYLQDSGISVPEQVSVAGFDNITLSEMVRPKITTIDYMLYQRCKLATLAMIDMIDRNECCVFKTEYMPQLVIRESTGPVRNL